MPRCVLDGLEWNPQVQQRAGLTTCELEVLALLATGFRNSALAKQLVVSEKPQIITSPRCTNTALIIEDDIALLGAALAVDQSGADEKLLFPRSV